MNVVNKYFPCCCASVQKQTTDDVQKSYSQTSCKQPPKNVKPCWSLTGGCRLQDHLDHSLGQNFVSLAYGSCRDLKFNISETPCFKSFIHVKIQFKKKISIILSVNFQSPIQFLLYYLSNSCLQEVKNNRNLIFNLLVLKVVMVAYKRWLLRRDAKCSDLTWKDLETFRILENWSLRIGGRL